MKKSVINYVIAGFIIISAIFAALSLSTSRGDKMIPVKDISIHMKLLSNGDAIMEEVWDITPKEGSIIYLEREDLGITEVTDFHVTDNGAAMKEISEWGDNRKEDVPCCGIEDFSSEYGHRYRLCWHINGHKRHIYEIRYTLKNFITKCADGSGFYHTFFLAESFAPAHISLKISAEDFRLSGVKAESYGFTGSAYFQNSAYRAKSFGKLRKNDYVRTVMTFPAGTFHDLKKGPEDSYSPWHDTRSEVMEYARKNSESRAYGVVLTVLICIAFPLAGIILLILCNAVWRRQKILEARDLSEITLEDSAKCYMAHEGLRGILTPTHLAFYAVTVCVMLGLGLLRPNYRLLGRALYGAYFAFFYVFIIASLFSKWALGKPQNTGKLIRLEAYSKKDDLPTSLCLEAGEKPADFLGWFSLEEAWVFLMLLGVEKYVISAYFAKWTAENLLVKTDNDFVYSSRYSFNTKVITDVIMTVPERTMYYFLCKAGQQFSTADIERHCRKNYKQYLDWLNSTTKSATDSLKKKGWLDGLYYEDCWWFVTCEPVLTEEGAKMAAKMREFIKICSDGEKLAKLLSEYDGYEALHILACASMTGDADSLSKQLDKLPGEIDKQQRQIWVAALTGSIFGSIAADHGTEAAMSARSQASGGGSSGGFSGGGYSSGGSSGGGGGGIL